jgi:IS5 family transposase
VQISQLLDGLGKAVVVRIHEDLTRGIRADKGRKGLSAEQVFRALVIKQMNGFSYDTLAFHLADSMSYRHFCRIGIADKPPSASALQRDIKRIRPDTLEVVNQAIVRKAIDLGVENGRKVRTDSTPIEANIHAPTDSWLLWDCVRALTRVLDDANENFDVDYRDHRRRAKKRFIAIEHARKHEQRIPLYRDLLQVTGYTVGYAEAAIERLQAPVSTGSITKDLLREALRKELQRLLGLTRRIIDQTERRVLRGESVPAGEKLVSIFEPHVDILVKDRRETLYGHKAGLTTGASGLVLDLFIHDGNWADAGVAVDAVKRVKKILRKTPVQASFDGGFTSKDNHARIKGEGVRDVVFTKAKGIDVADMAKSSWIYKRLRNFRAGIEAGISFFKRVFGLDRCNWSGFESFKAYALASVVSANLLILARHLLA